MILMHRDTGRIERKCWRNMAKLLPGESRVPRPQRELLAQLEEWQRRSELAHAQRLHEHRVRMRGGLE